MRHCGALEKRIEEKIKSAPPPFCPAIRGRSNERRRWKEWKENHWTLQKKSEIC